jgi:predicted TIM-barrel fold metal-dependent hydrolase
MKKKNVISRRTSLKTIGLMGASALLGSKMASGKEQSALTPNLTSLSDTRKQIFKKVFQTPFIDTHEHLCEEKERLSGQPYLEFKCNDWTKIFTGYLYSDMLTAGMPQDAYDKFISPDVDPLSKWALLEPYWPAVKNTGYGQAIRIAIKELYGVDELSAKTIVKVQAGYGNTVKPGFYRRILCDLANIESCQVNCLTKPFSESDQPTLLMQDLGFLGMHYGPNFERFGKPTGIEVKSLADWHKVMDWWFDKYGKYAVAVKSQGGYVRNIDYERVQAERAEVPFQRQLEGKSPSPEDAKAIEDHFFWYAVDRATKLNLPVKIHTGYYAGQNYMPLERLAKNPGSATDLCRQSPNTRFVFFHICYPYYEPMIPLAKHYTNAYIDMCWSWIMNPVAAKDFLKKYLVCAPTNKITVFGGDYVPVEPVLGHAVITRHGVALALSELVEEGWLSLDDAMALIEPIMYKNARQIYNLEEKTKILKNVKWS